MSFPVVFQAPETQGQQEAWLEVLVENMGRVFMTHDFEAHLQVSIAILLCMVDGHQHVPAIYFAII